MFGRQDDSGRFLRLTEVRLVPGRTFGWRIRLGCTGPVEYTETLQLPAPGDWSSDPENSRETSISKDGTIATTHDWTACLDGWIEHGWSVAAADPPGEWTITVQLDGYVPQVWRVTFRR